MSLFGRLNAFRRRLVQQSIGRTAWTLALVFAVFALLEQIPVLVAIAFWAFATLAVVWPAIVNTQDLVPEAPPETGAVAYDADTPTMMGVSSAVSVSRGAADPVADIPWQSLVDAMPEPSLVVDSDSFIVHLNPQTADLFPRARVGLPLTSVMRSPALISAVEAVDLSLTHRVVQIEDRVPTTRKWSAIVCSLAGGAEEMQPSKLVLLRDLTAEQQHAQQRSDFIAHASHELRTPLASLKSMVETLQGRASNDPAARERFLAMMQTQATRMSRLIDDLLSLSRAESRVHVAPNETVDVGVVIASVVETLQPLAEAHETSIEVANTARDTIVRGDRDDLIQVFQNLIQNALKYGGDQDAVRVTISDRDRPGAQSGELWIDVTDKGPGIAKEHIGRLTERFYRVSVTASRNAGGTGLGLAIVKYLVSRHRGRLEIASQVGSGSTFSVVFERARRPDVQRLQPPSSEATFAGSK